MNELALFAGAGGGILGGKLLGWRTVCAVERDGYAAQVLAQRQNDGGLEPFPIWSDVCNFDGRPWRGIVDVISGGFPCQDISAAGNKAGIDGEKSGLWRHMARIIDEVRPRYVFLENSPLLVSNGLVRVLGDLAMLGFDAQWGVMGAIDAGMDHNRKRLWLVANADGNGLQGVDTLPSPAQAQEGKWSDVARVVSEIQSGRKNRIPESWILRESDGVADRVDRTIAIGNGQVPFCADMAWRVLNNAQ
jgi:DNA (cytosine-5)-methyltransferase 1